MMTAKLNVLHLHLTDGDSFPLEIPKLGKTEENFYSVQDIQSLIEYAEIRGIEIIPEVDTPSHTYSWNKFDESINICTSPEIQQRWADYCPTPPCGQLDISNPKTFEILGTILE